MKEIKLANGKGIALVDDEDYEFLNSKKWFLSGKYARTGYRKNRKIIKHNMHNYLINIPDGFFVDHIDRNGLNYQKENLRVVTRQQNQMNRSSYKNSSSKYKGVSWHKKNKKWTTHIKFNYKDYNLGYFDDEKDAARTYNKAAEELFGEYAYLNEV